MICHTWNRRRREASRTMDLGPVELPPSAGSGTCSKLRPPAPSQLVGTASSSEELVKCDTSLLEHIGKLQVPLEMHRYSAGWRPSYGTVQLIKRNRQYDKARLTVAYSCLSHPHRPFTLAPSFTTALPLLRTCSDQQLFSCLRPRWIVSSGRALHRRHFDPSSRSKPCKATLSHTRAWLTRRKICGY